MIPKSSEVSYKIRSMYLSVALTHYIYFTYLHSVLGGKFSSRQDKVRHTGTLEGGRQAGKEAGKQVLRR
jgi:hypothetical protein